MDAKNELLRTCLELSSLHSILPYPSGKSFSGALLVSNTTLVRLSRARRSRSLCSLEVRERASTIYKRCD